MWHIEPPLSLSFPTLGMEGAGNASGFQIQLWGFLWSSKFRGLATLPVHEEQSTMLGAGKGD